jgi:hypothetical protein
MGVSILHSTVLIAQHEASGQRTKALVIFSTTKRVFPKSTYETDFAQELA